MSPVCTHFSFRKLLPPFPKTEIDTTDVRTAEPGGHPGGDMSSLARDRTEDQDRELGGGINSSTLSIWQHSAVCHQGHILCLCASVSHHIQGTKHTLEVTLRCNVKISKSSTIKATSSFPKLCTVVGFVLPLPIVALF